MSDVTDIYKELLASDEGDILVKLKDGKQLKIISFLVKRRSSVFKSMLESSMKEAATGVVDLSLEYTLEAFREFMAYVYYSKLHTGSYLPLLFELLCITEYYDVAAYRSYIHDRILGLITDVPICLVIASEALKHGTLTVEIYSRCLTFLVTAMEPQMHGCFDSTSGDKSAWCCSSHSTKRKEISSYPHGRHGRDASHLYTVDGRLACIYMTIRGSVLDTQTTYTQRCCMHGPSKDILQLVKSEQLPDFIVDDVNLALKKMAV
ncbi:hypothetical protein EMPS_07507 [Entomortierella parvispora]|uniref:BTB domain-containing protein n=1 Tax=Entomortierella parvispora TaxID=205924 RepID=A0A9P3HEF5_9FUNG|nr:hypothetical protein EMPS_07507 [Entomortierella parvispora]